MQKKEEYESKLKSKSLGVSSMKAVCIFNTQRTSSQVTCMKEC